MSQYNVSGHFLHSSRRMAQPQSQIFLGKCKSDPPTPPTGRDLNDAQRLSVAAATKKSQLESAMWNPDSAAPSPNTRSRIQKADNAFILGGANRRHAGRSNMSNVDDIVVQPGVQHQPGGAAGGVDINYKRGTRAGVRAAGTNSAEFADTAVGYSVVGRVATPNEPDHGRGVRKLDCEMSRDHLNHAAKPLPTPKRERTPPPPLPERRHHHGLRRVESPLRTDYVSEQWCRFGENASFHRKQGTRYFPGRSSTPTEILPIPQQQQEHPSSARSSSVPRQQQELGEEPQSAKRMVREIRAADMIDKNFKPDSETPNAKAAAARRARMSPQRSLPRQPSPFSAAGLTKKELRENAAAGSSARSARGGGGSGVPLTGSAARMHQQQNQSSISLGSGADIRYVPRKAFRA